MINLRSKLKPLFTYHTISGFTRLVLFISISVLSLSFFVFVFQEFETTRSYILKNFEQTISIQRSMIENWLEKYAGRIKTISELKSTQDGDIEAIKQDINAFSRNNVEFSWISFIDVNGRTLEGENVADREYFKQGLLGKSFTTDVLYTRKTNRPVIVFSSPAFNHNGKVIGVVAGAVRLTTISKVMEQFQFGATGETYLADRKGLMLTPTRLASGAAQDGRVSVQGTFGFNEALQGKSGSAVYKNFRGQRVFGAFSSIGKQQWVIIAEVDEKEVLAPLYTKLRVLGLLYLVLLALVAYFISAFGRKINIPFFNLVKMANQVEAGDYNVVLQQNHDTYFLEAPRELQYLKRAFISMTQQLITTINELNQMNTLLIEAEDKFQSLVENSLVGVYFILDGKIMYLNPKMEEMIGYTLEEAGQLNSFLDYVHPDDRAKALEKFQKSMTAEKVHDAYEMRILRKDGTFLDTYVLVNTCAVNGKPAVLGSMIDISDRKKWESKLEYVSYHDAGTELYNRAYFELQINQMSKSGRKAGVIMCDVDGLKQINDSLGHQAGDALIKAAAQAILFADRNLVTARIGGDEFAILIWDATAEKLKTLCNEIAANIESYHRNQGALPLFISYGCCLGQGYDIHRILRQADDAMYQDKNNKRAIVREKIASYLERNQRQPIP